MKIKIALLFYLGIMFCVSAQNDSIVSPNFTTDYAKGFSINAKIIEKKLENDLSNNSNIDLSYLFKTPKEKLPLSYTFDINKYLHPNKKSDKSILEEKKLPDDVLVVKHFKGVNTTITKLKTTQNLGTINSNTKFVKIEYRDFGLVDGDRIRVFLNEKPIDTNIQLDGLYYTLKIDLPKNVDFNRIDIQAINQGIYGPNTAEFILYDDKGNVIAHKSWNLKTNQNATLGIMRN